MTELYDTTILNNYLNLCSAMYKQAFEDLTSNLKVYEEDIWGAVNFLMHKDDCLYGLPITDNDFKKMCEYYKISDQNFRAAAEKKIRQQKIKELKKKNGLNR